MTKIIAAAIQADADLCNAVNPPVKGCHAGGGIHLVIPANFATLISQGTDVPGCSYARVEADGSLYVPDKVQAAILIPAIINALPAPLQAQATAFALKLSTAAIATASLDLTAAKT